jgi:hypothetical protein
MGMYQSHLSIQLKTLKQETHSFHYSPKDNVSGVAEITGITEIMTAQFIILLSEPYFSGISLNGFTGVVSAHIVN